VKVATLCKKELKELFNCGAERLEGCGDLLGLIGGEARAVELQGAHGEKEFGGHAEAVLIHWGRQSFILSRKWLSLAPEIELEVEFLWVGEEIPRFNLWTEGLCIRTD
jgi:hypothetical protein